MPDPPSSIVLNPRQRAYLLAIFEVDQAVEAEMRALPFRPFYRRPKASEWRWLEYSEPVPEIDKPASQLYAAIKKTALIDQGTGSTFTALADRGLIELDWRDLNVRGQRKPYVRLTAAGRKLARAWTGQNAHRAPPTGTLREWHWRALAKAYAAGDEGLLSDAIGFRTLQRLQTYTRGKLVTESRYSYVTREYRVWFTPYGRAFYMAEWARYRELYPEVEAPKPVGGAPPTG